VSCIELSNIKTSFVVTKLKRIVVSFVQSWKCPGSGVCLTEPLSHVFSFSVLSQLMAKLQMDGEQPPAVCEDKPGLHFWQFSITIANFKALTICIEHSCMLKMRTWQ
jgi:hypothetical protein